MIVVKHAEVVTIHRGVPGPCIGSDWSHCTKSLYERRAFGSALLHQCNSSAPGHLPSGACGSALMPPQTSLGEIWC